MDPVSLVSGLAGLVLPPLFDIIKMKVVGDKVQDPKELIAKLAVSGEKAVEVLPAFIDSYQKLLETESQYRLKLFNVDVVGQPSQFIVDLRAAIRPVTVILSLGLFFLSPFVNVPSEILNACSAWIGFWFGNRFVERGLRNGGSC